MKRYDTLDNFGEICLDNTVENPEGDYVKYEDVVKMITGVANFLKEDVNWTKKTRDAYADWLLKQIKE